MKNKFGLGLLILILVVTEGQTAKQIAITFDDAPRPDTNLSGAQRTEKILDALSKSGVDQAMFFVTTKHLNENNKSTLDQYEKAGHLIANHSDQHLWFNQTTTQKYQQDFLTAHEQLKEYPHFRPFFRYPYLDEGKKKSKVKKMTQFLTKHGYQNAYVTVDNYDWYLDRLFQDAIDADSIVDMNQLRKLYVDVLFEAITFYDHIATEYLGRSPKHVLLLHDNDLAAYFIIDLVAHLRSQGWEIISPLEAYQDPIASQLPKTLFTGQGRVAALARDAGAEPKDLVHVAEDEQKLAQLFEDYEVLPDLGADTPEWFFKEMQSQVGTWRASNEKYWSDREPFTEFEVVWEWGIGKQSLIGQLHAIQEGEPTGKLWTYTMYWDPIKAQARLIQFGYLGRLGDGFIKPLKNGQMESIQTFSRPQSKSRQEKRLSVLTPEGRLTTSFQMSKTGDWQGKRSYLWVKQ